MFEKFTDRARRATVLAQEEAAALNHNWIGWQHLVLGVLAESESVGALALKETGFVLEDARGAVADNWPPGDEKPSGHVPFTPAAKRSLERALREALQLGHNYIAPEHVLLGIFRAVDAPELESLIEDGPAVRKAVIHLLQVMRPEPPTIRRQYIVAYTVLIDDPEDGHGPEIALANTKAGHYQRVTIERARP